MLREPHLRKKDDLATPHTLSEAGEGYRVVRTDLAVSVIATSFPPACMLHFDGGVALRRADLSLEEWDVWATAFAFEAFIFMG